MKSAKAMAGQPVILEGRRIGRVLQVELSEDLTAMTGLWADCGLKGTRYMTGEQIQLLGDVAVIVKEMGKRRRLGEQTLFRRAVASDGSRLGAILDALIDEQTHKVDALLLSEGFLSDLTKGRRAVRQYMVQPGTGSVVLKSRPDEEGGVEHEGRLD